MVVMAAADENELTNMVATAAAYDEGPIALRYPRGEVAPSASAERSKILEIGKGRILREGSDVAILSLGTRLAAALEAASLLDEQGISCTVADARFAKPIDSDLVNRLVRHHRALVTVEEGAAGGFGSQVLHYLANAGLLDRGLTVRALTLPDRLQDHDDQAAQYAEAGLDAKGIAKVVIGAVPAKTAIRTRHVAAAARSS
jgi:1-deoxy-D-xylulose-5-phosphate synthase